MTFRIGVAALLTVVSLTSSLHAQASGSLTDQWNAIYLNDSKIGFFHVTIDQVEAGGRKVLHSRQHGEMRMRRFNSVAQIGTVTDTFELADGRLYALDSRIRMANEQRLTKGRLGNDGKFHLTTSASGKTESQTIDWDSSVEGPYAHERYLRSGEVKPGRKRVSKVFLPELNQIAERTLVAKDWEEVKLLDGESKKLLAVKETNDKIPQANTFWIDQEGEILKAEMEVAGMKLAVYRVSRTEALKGHSTGAELVDVNERTLVKPDRAIAKAHSREEAVYRLTFEDEKSRDTIPEASYQQFLEKSDKGLLVKVKRTIPGKGESGTSEVASEFIESNGFIQSDDPQIIATAKKVTEGVTNPWRKVQLLEQWVNKNMTNKDFSVAFADAKEVMQTRQGDCTEHAVLLAALCRAVGVPSRVAMGLVYIEGLKAFGYHMWTEVNIGGTWYPADGTLGQGQLGAGHIKVADGSLKGTSALSTMLPILQVIGKMKIEVESVK